MSLFLDHRKQCLRMSDAVPGGKVKVKKGGCSHEQVALSQVVDCWLRKTRRFPLAPATVSHKSAKLPEIQDLCVYLISQQADPDAKDNKARTFFRRGTDWLARFKVGLQGRTKTTSIWLVASIKHDKPMSMSTQNTHGPF